MNIVIESGIPVPKHSGRIKSPLREAMESMKPGDSFIVDDLKVASAARDTARRMRQAANSVFLCRKVAGEGWRIWRVE